MRNKTAAVVVVCHAEYSHCAAKCIEAIERQTLPFAKKVFVWDGLSFQFPNAPAGWTFRADAFNGPNGARNAGIEACLDHEWICFWDADNIMPEDYHAKAFGTYSGASNSVAVCYPNVQRVDYSGRLLHLHRMPEWSPQVSQSHTLTDSSSFWRTEALCEVGGWDIQQVRRDDFTLALRIFRAGWRGTKLPATINHLRHFSNRSGNLEAHEESLMRAYHFGFVTLWGGRDLNVSQQVLEWLETAEIPPFSSLHWVDNSGGTMTAQLQHYAQKFRSRFQSITIIDGGNPYQMADGEPYKSPARHKHVAYLYNRVLPKLKDEIIVFLEDDTIPPKDGIRQLLKPFNPGENVAISASVYRSRPSPQNICASKDLKRWVNPPRYDQVGEEPFPVGMTGLGFALVANWALQECLPVFCELTDDGRLMGWDGNLGMALTAKGYRLLVDPRVKSKHLCPSVIEWEKCNLPQESQPPY